MSSGGKLRLLLDEIVTAEGNYVDNLALLVEKFVKPLRAMARKGDIELPAINRIFSNVEDLSNFHKLFYSTVKEQKTAAGIANTFLKYADFLKMYTLYVNNYDRCCDSIDHLRQNEKFSAFLSHTRKDKECKGNNLMSFLIMPVQRIPLYELLLLELLKICQGTPPPLPPSDPDGGANSPRQLEHDSIGHNAIPKIELALSKVRDIAKYVNENKRRAEDQSKLLELQERLTGDDALVLVVPSRYLIREGELQKLSTLNFKRTRRFFLFNDMLLWTTPSYRVRGYIDLAPAQIFAPGINTEVTEEQPQQFSIPIYSHSYAIDVAHAASLVGGFEIIHPKHNAIVVFCADEADRRAWITDIMHAIKNAAAKDADVRLRSRLHSLAEIDSKSASHFKANNNPNPSRETTSSRETSYTEHMRNMNLKKPVSSSSLTSAVSAVPSDQSTNSLPLSASKSLSALKTRVSPSDQSSNVPEQVFQSLTDTNLTTLTGYRPRDSPSANETTPTGTPRNDEHLQSSLPSMIDLEKQLRERAPSAGSTLELSETSVTDAPQPPHEAFASVETDSLADSSVYNEPSTNLATVLLERGPSSSTISDFGGDRSSPHSDNAKSMDEVSVYSAAPNDMLDSRPQSELSLGDSTPNYGDRPALPLPPSTLAKLANRSPSSSIRISGSSIPPTSNSSTPLRAPNHVTIAARSPASSTRVIAPTSPISDDERKDHELARPSGSSASRPALVASNSPTNRSGQLAPNGPSLIIPPFAPSVALEDNLVDATKAVAEMDYHAFLEECGLTDLDRFTPHIVVRKVLEAVAIVMGADPVSAGRGRKRSQPDYWIPAVNLVEKPHFLRLLVGHAEKRIKLQPSAVTELRTYISNPLLDPKLVFKSSRYGGILWNWVRARYAYQIRDESLITFRKKSSSSHKPSALAVQKVSGSPAGSPSASIHRLSPRSTAHARGASADAVLVSLHVKRR